MNYSRELFLLREKSLEDPVEYCCIGSVSSLRIIPASREAVEISTSFT